MSPSNMLCIGMDAHTDAITVASGAQEHGAEVLSLGAKTLDAGDNQWSDDRACSQSGATETSSTSGCRSQA